MKKTLLLIGGIANTLLALFHVWLCLAIHRWHGVQPEVKALTEMLAFGGMLTVAFLAITSLAFAKDVLTTRLGRAVILLNITVYATRAAGEFVFTTSFHPAIFAVCVAIAALYVAVWLVPDRKPSLAGQPAHT
jgi:hypothetical protein